MKLTSLNIKNFRSIEDASFEFNLVDGGYSYSLIGVNESGKSSFLKAISAVKNSEDVRYPKDFFNSSLPIEITLNYEVTAEEEIELKNEFTSLEFDEELLVQVKVKNFSVCTKFNPTAGAEKTTTEKINFQKSKFNKYTLDGTKPIKKVQHQPQPTCVKSTLPESA